MDAVPKLSISALSAERDWKTYGVLIALYLPIIVPILRADFYFEDDLGRALKGKHSWDPNGRPLTTLLMRALQCYDHAMVDISPLPQMGAIAILIWLGVMLARRFAVRSPWAAGLATFPLGAQPFFLANLSYRFDALSMALSMFFALLPIARPGSGHRGWWLGVLWLFVALNLYQPAINAYLVFILLEVLWNMVRKAPPSSLWRQLIARATQALTGMLVYQLLVGMPMINGWVKRYSQKIQSLHELAQVPTRIAEFYRYIGDSFNAQWWMYFSPLLLVMAVLPVLIGLRYARNAHGTWRTLPAAGLLSAIIAIPPAAALCVMGPMLALVTPLVTARVMMGVGAWLSLGLFVMSWACEAWRLSSRWMLAAGWMLAVGMMVIAGAYGSAQSAQKQFEADIATHLADDYATLRSEAGARALLLDGMSGYAPATIHAIRQFPLFGKLINVYMDASAASPTDMYLAYFLPGAAYIEHPGDANDPLSSRIRSALTQTCKLKPLKSTAHYDMYAVGNVAIGIFDRQSTRRCDLPGDAGSQELASSAKRIYDPNRE